MPAVQADVFYLQGQKAGLLPPRSLFLAVDFVFCPVLTLLRHVPFRLSRETYLPVQSRIRYSVELSISGRVSLALAHS